MAYEFTAASSQYLSTASSPVGAAPLTLACWFYPNTITANYALFQISDGNTTNRHGLAALGGVTGDPLRLYSDGTAGGPASGAVDSSTGFTASNWQHACGVVASSNSRTVYLNGGNNANNTTNVNNENINQINIATRPFNSVNGLFLDGRLAEVGIWNAALTADEIASLAKGMTCDKVRPQNLVFYAPLVRDLIDAKGGLTITNNNGAKVATHPRVYA
jgi:hypothetical protein